MVFNKIHLIQHENLLNNSIAKIINMNFLIANAKIFLIVLF